jgi:hypothetical protein
LSVLVPAARGRKVQGRRCVGGKAPRLVVLARRVLRALEAPRLAEIPSAGALEQWVPVVFGLVYGRSDAGNLRARPSGSGKRGARVLEVAAAEDEDSVEAISAESADLALGVSVRVRRLDRRARSSSDNTESHSVETLGAPDEKGYGRACLFSLMVSMRKPLFRGASRSVRTTCQGP